MYSNYCRVVDEELISLEIGVANEDDSYQTAKRKLNLIIDWHVENAKDPLISSQPKLLGWRTANYLHETSDVNVAKNWEVHHDIFPIFEGDPNTKLK